MLEAALFMSSQPILAVNLSKILSCDEGQVKELLYELKKELEDKNRGIWLMESSAGWQLRVKPEYVQHVKALTPYHELGKGMLRVLALVAYKQPITQSEIVKVIGNRTYEYVRALEARDLIRTVKQGRTKALCATKGFADYFGIEKPEDVKRLFEEKK